ncbi:threonine synthase [Algoriphagus resistens]|uniref:threonine synthase n=1 Tax=Algoriphagus resistens TaxID=1750590 RepID=UPI000716C361|nr:threonine synthase [Algoriphagus resistens]
MKFFSTNNPGHQVDLVEAVIKGLAPDQGLYMPMKVPVLSNELLNKLPQMTFHEIGYEVIGALFSTALSQGQIKELVDHTLTFDAPLVKVEEDVYALELFHGPTLAFKDFGARFCSKLMSMLMAKSDQKVRVLVATSGDTGSAVANGFLEVDGVEVIILFPKGKVSELQEKQFTTLGRNITALEVDGVFDDCQRMVKEAFLDAELNEKLLLTSANSINVARWIPQCLYYFYAFSRLPKNDKKVAFAVPSGNFGNIAAGILAQRMGLPIAQFVAATNVNKVVPDYLNGADFQTMASIATISNSMDVGNPSNFPRLLALYGGDEQALRDNVKGYFYTDEETVEVMQEVYRAGYTLDPHGAVGYKGLMDFMAENDNFQGVFLETAHPGKFRETVENALDLTLTLPGRLAAFMDGEKKVHAMGNDFKEFKGYLMRLDRII